jgi:anti-sigma regulatory factor (Ser/Thr protein kinase)
MSAGAETLRLTFPAEPDSVPEVRHAVADRAQELGMEGARIDELKTVVSEACSNVVLHAYPDREEPGPLEVELVSEAERLDLVVRDFGAGIRPRRVVGRPSLRLGLRLIGALSSRFHLISTRGRGTEIRIQMTLGRGGVAT